MTPERPVRPKRRPDLPERIVAVAVGLFDPKGYAGASMEQIATALGLTAGALYQHVKDKQAILDAVIDTAAERQRQTLATGDWPRPCDRLLELVRRMVRLTTEETALLSVARHDRHWAGVEAQGRAQAADDEITAAWLEALLACRPDLSLAVAGLTVEAALGVAYSPTHTLSPLPPARRAALLAEGIAAAFTADGRSTGLSAAGDRPARGRRRRPS